jgi:peptidoglycan hydrolase-like protein with peptidoglycan-binding domain
MSRSFWVAVMTVLVMSLIPGAALAANSSSSRPSHASATHNPKDPRVQRVVVVEPGTGVTLPGGSANVRSLQRQLVRMGFSPGAVDGRDGPLTTQAVRSFQQAHGLVVDGIVGPETRKALARGSLVSGAGYLQPGGSPAVRSLQRRLTRAGFSPGPADGRYGPLTARAVKRFQQAQRLAADGIAGALTLHALGSRQPKVSSPQSNSAPRPSQHAAPGPRRHTTPRPGQHAAPRPHRHANPTTPKPQTTPAVPQPQTAPAQRTSHGSPWVKWGILALLIAIAIAVFVLVGPGRRPTRMTAKQAPEEAQPAPEQAAARPAMAEVAPIALAAAAATDAALKSAAATQPASDEATPEPPALQVTPAPVGADNPPVPDEAPPRSASAQARSTGATARSRPGGSNASRKQTTSPSTVSPTRSRSTRCARGSGGGRSPAGSSGSRSCNAS